MKAFKEKIVLFRGVCSGIGLATARLLATEGANGWQLAKRLQHVLIPLQET